MSRKLKTRTEIPDNPLPESKTFVTVRQLEEIALKSQAGLKPKGKGIMDLDSARMEDPDFRSKVEELARREREAHGNKPAMFQFGDMGEFVGLDFLGAYGRQLGVDMRKAIIPELKTRFPAQTLIAADVNCEVGRAAAELNSIEGVEAFGTGGWFLWDSRGGLPRERYIVEEANELARTIPEKSFHLLVSRVMEQRFEEVPRLFPSLYKILRLGGLAVFDLEFWWKNLDDILPLDAGIQKSLRLVDKKSGYSNSINGYLTDWREQGELKEKRVNPALTHFEMRKPW